MDDGLSISLRLALVLALVLLNGMFVAAEFSIVTVRRTRLENLAAQGRPLANLSLRAISNLNNYLAATQLGITISSLALGWIGEPALAHLIEPLLSAFPGWLATTGSHAIAVAIAMPAEGPSLGIAPAGTCT